VVVGIRPEDFRLAAPDTGSTDGSLFKGKVDVVEHLGNEQLVYVRLPGTVLPDAVKAAKEVGPDMSNHGTTAVIAAPTATIRLAPTERLVPGETVTLTADVNKLHLFDRATSRRLA